MKRSQSLYLGDIKDAIEAVIKFTDGMYFDEFNSDIPWSLMARMRDKLIHGYFGVDATLIWKTAKEDLPEILPLINKLYEQNRNDA